MIAPRDTILRMAREAGFEVHERKQQVRVGADALLGIDSSEKLERFADLVAAHAWSLKPPPAIVVKTADIDPALLRDMLAKSPPMPLLPAPAEPTPEAVAAAVAAEREACAWLAETEWSTDGEKAYGDELAAAIRARGAA